MHGTTRNLWSMAVCFAIGGLFAGVALAQAPKPDDSGKIDDYNQWKQALGSGRATDARSLQAPPGFQVELVRSAGADEGSWIALAFDSKGRLLVSREDKGIWRMTLPAPNAKGELDPAAVRTELVNDTLLECRGLLWAYDSLYANANNSKALYRLRDLDGDDKFEKVELLKATAAHVGHGRNDLALGPDGMIYSIHGDDVRLPADYDPKGSPLRNYLDARLLDCKWDETLFNASMELPGGYVARTDPDGKKWEVVAGGLRNPYGLDFNSDGELFTYDADMEWDVGMPWYRPTRVLHLASGADFGWRRGTGAWPAWYPDGWPSTHDVGLGSPTAVKFGTRTKFPPAYQRALFILDWSYGRIIAVHLQPNGASYTAREETFVLGRPLNVTDLEVGPDGAMYFTTGGRRTQSGLYRIRYVGPQAASPAPASPAPAPAGAKQGATGEGKQAETEQRAAESQKTKTPEESRKLRSLRKSLEALHGRVDPKTLDVAGQFLAHEDPWIRNAARVAIEHQPVESWTKQALEETTPWADVTGLLALARLAPAETRPKLLDRALSLDTRRMASGQQVTLLRAIAIALARHGRPSEAETRRLTDWAESRFPSTDPLVNMQLSELLVYLESTQVVSKTLPLLTTAKTQEEKVHYLMVLRKVRQPWTAAQRKLYFEWLRQAEQFYGAHYLAKFVQHIRDDAVATLGDSERTALAALIAPNAADSAGAANGTGAGAPGAGATSIADALKSRPFVRDWKLDDLIGALDDTVRKPDASRGRAAYEAAQCHRCHRFGATGSPVGPDLTQVGRRFGRRDLLISILYPSHVIDEKYRVVSITTQDGRVLTGQVTASTDKAVTLLPDLLQPEKAVTIEKSQIETTTPVLVSPMPSGLLNTFSRDEILDLLALLESGPPRGLGILPDTRGSGILPEHRNSGVPPENRSSGILPEDRPPGLQPDPPTPNRPDRLATLKALAADVSRRVDDDFAPLWDLYRELHANPELSLEEARTAGRLAAALRGAGCEVTERVGGHGVVGVLKSGEGPVVMLRADMDALPIVERTGLPYASVVKTRDREGREVGVMHACGHDVNMTCLVGVARQMARMRERWRGTVLFVGQPAEEIGAGARMMLSDGLFTRFPKPAVAYALHCDGRYPHGEFNYREGQMQANVDTVDIFVRGKGGHGAAPQATIDPVVLACRIVVDLQTIVSREVDPLDAAVVTVGSIHGGVKHNVIPDEVKLQLTVRTTNDKTRRQVLESIERMAKAAALGARAPEPVVKVDPMQFTPALTNDPELTRYSMSVLREVFGADRVHERPMSLGGEDFSQFVLSGVPGCYFFVGVAPPDRVKEARSGGRPLPATHSDQFAPVAEPTIKSGVTGMTLVITDRLAVK